MKFPGHANDSVICCMLKIAMENLTSSCSASLKEQRYAFSFFFYFTYVCKADCYIFSFHFFVHSFLFSLVNISPILRAVLLVLTEHVSGFIPALRLGVFCAQEEVIS